MYVFLAQIFNIAILSTVAWLDHYEPDPSYTLVNLLMSKVCFFCLTFLIITLLDQFRYIYGQVPLSICHAKTSLGAAVIQQITLLSTAIVVTKYLFIFHLKNPLAIEEGFWCRFISSWIFLVSNLIQIVFLILPGIIIYFFIQNT